MTIYEPFWLIEKFTKGEDVFKTVKLSAPPMLMWDFTVDLKHAPEFVRFWCSPKERILQEMEKGEVSLMVHSTVEVFIFLGLTKDMLVNPLEVEDYEIETEEGVEKYAVFEVPYERFIKKEIGE